MKFPQQHITKLSRKVVAIIGYVMTWFIMFPFFVLTGIFHIVMDKVIDNENLNIIPNQDDAKTRETSVESKIHPKNTKNTLDLDEEGNLGGRL
tara:strand:+ start:151 stop:429 length:279 start_codon:yes stop_codon:yes gene_type:complete